MAIHVTAPNPDFDGRVAGVAFKRGEATVESSNQAALAYFKRKGYKLQEDAVPTLNRTKTGWEPQPEPVAEDLSKLTVAQLRELAQERGVDLAGASRKAELLEALSSHEKGSSLSTEDEDGTEAQDDGE